MRRLSMLAACLLFFGCLTGTTRASQNTIIGDWAGGVQIKDKWFVAQAHFEYEHLNVKGTFDISDVWFVNARGLPVLQLNLKPPGVRFQVATEMGALNFNGHLSGGELSGDLQTTRGKGTFRLIRIATIRPPLYDLYSGNYQLKSGKIIHVGRGFGGAFTYTDYDTGSIRALYPSSDHTFFYGPSYLIPFPKEAEVSFEENKNGEVTGLVLSQVGRRGVHAKKVKLYREEEIKFQNGDVQLVGALKLPLTKGPHPAVVMIGGAGPSTRRSGEATQLFFVNQGIAVLTYDKRGAGSSSGVLEKASFEDLADDMLAGVRALRRRNDINPRQIGVRGASEGGWVAPLCASRSNGEVAFVIAISAGGLGPAEQEVRRVEVQMRGDRFAESEVKEASRLMRLKFDFALTGKGWEEYEAAARNAEDKEWFPYVLAPLSKDDPDWEFGRQIVRYDPIPVLEKVKCPILILLGDLDWNYLNEAKEESIAEQALRRGGNRDFTFEVFHLGNHALWLSNTGGVLEFPFLKSYVPGYFQKQIKWLLKRVDVPSSRRAKNHGEIGSWRSSRSWRMPPMSDVET